MRRLLSGVALLALLASQARAQFSPVLFSFDQSVSSAVISATISTVTVRTLPPKYYALQVSGAGASPTSWDVRLEGSLDSVKWVPLISHTSAIAVGPNGAIMFSTGNAVVPVAYIRAYVNAVSLGSATKITTTVFGSQ